MAQRNGSQSHGTAIFFILLGLVIMGGLYLADRNSRETTKIFQPKPVKAQPTSRLPLPGEPLATPESTERLRGVSTPVAPSLTGNTQPLQITINPDGQGGGIHPLVIYLIYAAVGLISLGILLSVLHFFRRKQERDAYEYYYFANLQLHQNVNRRLYGTDHDPYDGYIDRPRGLLSFFRPRGNRRYRPRARNRDVYQSPPPRRRKQYDDEWD